MAYIAPDTIVKIMKNVPLDNTYDHTVWFASKVAQETYFSGSGVVKYTLSNDRLFKIALDEEVYLLDFLKKFNIINGDYKEFIYEITSSSLTNLTLTSKLLVLKFKLPTSSVFSIINSL